MRSLRISAGILILLLIISSAVYAQTWNLQIVDNAGTIGAYSKIAVTSDGTPYILYDGRLAWWVALNDSVGSWESMSLDISAGNTYACTFEADHLDNLHITWYDYSYLHYAILDSETKTWVLEDEHVTDNAFSGHDIVLSDSMGILIPHIVFIIYNDSNESTLKMAKRNHENGNWSIDNIYDDHYVTGQPSIAIDSTGTYHVSFYESLGEDLMYATKSPADSIWMNYYVDVGRDVGVYNSIVIDEDGFPLIVYYDDYNDDLKYAKLLSP